MNSFLDNQWNESVTDRQTDINKSCLLSCYRSQLKISFSSPIYKEIIGEQVRTNQKDLIAATIWASIYFDFWKIFGINPPPPAEGLFDFFFISIFLNNMKLKNWFFELVLYILRYS